MTIRDHGFGVVFIDTVRFIFEANRQRINIVYDFELFSRYSGILSYLSGAGARVGFHNYMAEGLYRGNLLTHKVHYSTYQHIAYNFLALAYSIRENEEDIPLIKQQIENKKIVLPKIVHDQSYIQQITALYPRGRKTVVINPDSGAMLPLRNWSVDYFVETINEIIYQYEVNVVLVGREESKAVSEYIIAHTGESQFLVDLVGFTSTVRELICVIQSGDVFLTSDGGPAHFAALTDTPTVVLFGPESPDMYGPLSHRGSSLYSHYFCSPCF